MSQLMAVDSPMAQQLPQLGDGTDMHNQRVIRRSLLCCVDGANGGAACCVCPKSIDGLGWECHRRVGFPEARGSLEEVSSIFGVG